MNVVEVVAPAKLTWNLFIDDRRSDGYHNLRSEMVSLDLSDRLIITEPGEGVELKAEPRARAEGLDLGGSNLVSRALAQCGRSAHVRIEKRIPLGGGLGGGSSDAAAILRWAGVTDLSQGARLGGDVPFCMVGGRAQVGGLGEEVEPLTFQERSVVLLLPPFGVDTAAAYRALDELRSEGKGHHTRNDLTEAAEVVEPRLRGWRAMFRDLTGREPVLAGSGSTLFVEGSPAECGVEGIEAVEWEGASGTLIGARTIPASVGVPQNR